MNQSTKIKIVICSRSNYDIMGIDNVTCIRHVILLQSLQRRKCKTNKEDDTYAFKKLSFFRPQLNRKSSRLLLSSSRKNVPVK